MPTQRWRRHLYTCVTLGLTALAPPSLAREDFPRYPSLEPAVAFWTDVFGRYGVDDSIIHPAAFPQVVLEVLHFSEGVPAQVRRDREEAAKRDLRQSLLRLSRFEGTPETLPPSDRALHDRFNGIATADRFRIAADSLRAQRGIKERTRAALETAGQYLPAMETTFSQYSLPLKLTRLPLLESSFDVRAYSKVGAAGLWQFMPASARIYMRLDEVVDDRRDPWTSTDGAARHLRDDYALLGNWPLALTAYNHGRNGIARGLQQIGGSTLIDLIERYDNRRFGFASKNFYAEFLAVTDIERNREQFFPGLKVAAPVRFDEVEVDAFVPFSALATASGTDEATLRRLNPAYSEAVYRGRLWVPNGHRIRIPSGQAEHFRVRYVSLPAAHRADRQREYYRYHRIRKGEALGSIARRYGVDIRTLQQVNGIADAGRIRAGQTLKVPPGDSEPASLRKVQLRVHTVRPGQTLSAIARRYDVSVQTLARHNRLDDKHLIRPGQRLRIPG